MASFISFAERLDSVFRMTICYVVIFVLLIMHITSLPFSLITAFKVPFFLMVIYYWAIYRPTLVPVWFVFVAGITLDLLGTMPLGFNALVFVLAQMVVVGQRRFLMSQPFIVIWVGFAALMVFELLAQSIAISLMQMQWLVLFDRWPVLLLAVAVFPLVCVILHFTHKILPAPHPAMRFGAKA